MIIIVSIERYSRSKKIIYKVYFLYFEFIALIVKYFQSGFHFPLRYFVYIGITAIVRLIIVDHKSPLDVLIYSAAILLLVITLWLCNSKRLKRE